MIYLIYLKFRKYIARFTLSIIKMSRWTPHFIAHLALPCASDSAINRHAVTNCEDNGNVNKLGNFRTQFCTSANRPTKQQTRRR